MFYMFFYYIYVVTYLVSMHVITADYIQWSKSYFMYLLYSSMLNKILLDLAGYNF